MLSLRAAALTDIGRVRRENEDRYLLDEKTMLFVFSADPTDVCERGSAK